MALVSILTLKKGPKRRPVGWLYLLSEKGSVTTNLRSDHQLMLLSICHPKGQIASQGDYIVLDNPGLGVGSNVGLFRFPSSLEILLVVTTFFS